MTLDHDERPWWTFRLSDMTTVHVPADTEDAAKKALASNTLMRGNDLEVWQRRVDGLVGRSRWTTRASLVKEMLR